MIDHDLIRESRPGMWAHVTTLDSQSRDDLEETLRRIVDEILPESRDQAGWKGTMALASENRRRAVVVTLWDSVDAVISGGRSFRELTADDRSGRGVISANQRFEIVFDERADET